MRIIRLDGSTAAVDALAVALADALDGGPAVLPLAADAPLPAVAAGAAPVRDARRGTGSPAHDSPDGRNPGDGRDPDAGGVLVATSGSTGEPRLVALPAAALRASAGATATRLGGDARWLLALPADHVAGVQVVARSLLAGGPPAVQDLRGGFRPDGFVAATATLGPGRRCTSLVPTQLLRLLEAGGAAVEALRGYDAVLVGGAALDAGLRARAVAAGVRVVATYGMTETAGGCVYDGVPLDGVRVRLDPGSAGGPADGGLGQTGPPDTGPTDTGQAGTGPTDTGPPGTGHAGTGRADPERAGHAATAEVGRILLGGPTLAAAYLGRPGETTSAFGRDELGRREFRTGDLGRWVDGRLEVVGRADDVIVTGGEKVVPAAVERVLTAQRGVRAACVVGVPDRVWGSAVGAVVVVDDAARVDLLRAAVREALGRAAVPRVLRAVDALPLRGIGKPDRGAVSRLLATEPPSRPAG